MQKQVKYRSIDLASADAEIIRPISAVREATEADHLFGCDRIRVAIGVKALIGKSVMLTHSDGSITKGIIESVDDDGLYVMRLL